MRLYLREYIRGRTLEWFNNEIILKANWELINLTDSTRQGNLVAINDHTAIQIDADGLNKAIRQFRNAIVKLRAVKGPWDENWHIAGCHLTNLPVNLLNAN